MSKLVPALAVLCALLTFARADAATVLHVSARSLNFYYDRFLLEGDGSVRVVSSDGITMTGDAFSMDLKLNRFVLAGHVRVSGPEGAQQGAALADFLDFNRVYFIPLTSEPDRWTFVDGDFAHPLKGRTMPGDTFYFPDVGKSIPYLKGRSAVVEARNYLRFSGNDLDLANGLGAYVPTPQYYVNFSTDQHLSENSLSGANWDATYNFAGDANSISALHARYDNVNKAYLSFEQHFSSPKAYAVFSLNPATSPSKFWNLILSDKPSDTFQIRTFTQLHTYQFGFGEPDSANQFTDIQAVQAFHQSSLQLTAIDTNDTLLAPGIYDGLEGLPNHPWQLTLQAQTFDHRIGESPLFERLSYNVGYDHDVFGLQSLGGVVYPTIWQHAVDAIVYMPGFKLGNNSNEYKNYQFNASVEKNRTWFSAPHSIDITTSKVSLSRTFDRHFLSFLSYSVENTGDYYGAQQLLVYPSYTPVSGGVPYPGYAAFRGQATFRDLAYDFNYSNNGFSSFSMLLRKHDDFPQPISGFFATPPLDILGRPINTSDYLGEPPYDATFDLRMRINPHTAIDVARMYFFNFGNRGWSPEYVIQVTQ